MPRSKTRKHHHEPRRSAGTVDKPQGIRSAVPAAIIFCVLVGIAMAYFAAGASYIWLPVGAILGGVLGYYFGKQLDRSFSKK